MMWNEKLKEVGSSQQEWYGNNSMQTKHLNSTKNETNIIYKIILKQRLQNRPWIFNFETLFDHLL